MTCLVSGEQITAGLLIGSLTVTVFHTSYLERGRKGATKLPSC